MLPSILHLFRYYGKSRVQISLSFKKALLECGVPTFDNDGVLDYYQLVTIEAYMV